MFSEKKTKELSNPGSGQNRINDGTTIKGDISSNGYLRVDGIIEGNVKTPSKVVIGKTGIIIGTLSCENADIEGKIDGIINITETLSLKSTAQIEGEVVIGKLAVEPGAIFNATCLMKGSSTKHQTQINTTEKLKTTPFDRQQRAKTPLSKTTEL